MKKRKKPIVFEKCQKFAMVAKKRPKLSTFTFSVTLARALAYILKKLLLQKVYYDIFQ